MLGTVAFTSLGCDKNRVDSEVMLGILCKNNFRIVTEEAEADFIVINTCCFIKDALEESIETILEMAEYKKIGRCKGLIVAGCLGQRYQKEIFEEMPEVDAVIGTTAYESIAEVMKQLLQGQKTIKCLTDRNQAMTEQNLRMLSTPGYYAYLKISEGCDNHCTYCIIPKIRGTHRSRSLESLLEEAEFLAKQGVKELLLVAQDTSIYGKDLYGESKLHILLERLCKIEAIEWIRLLYCYPETLTEQTIAVMAKEPKICHYIDLPIQHASDTVLKRMGRKSTQSILKEKIAKLRKAMPDIAIRTTFIVGFPQNCQKEVNTIKKVLVEGKLPQEDIYCGRTQKDAPDIDGLVFFSSEEELLSGDFVKVFIKEASDYDLIGEVKNEPSE